VDSSSTDDSRLRGAPPFPDVCGAIRIRDAVDHMGGTARPPVHAGRGLEGILQLLIVEREAPALHMCVTYLKEYCRLYAYEL